MFYYLLFIGPHTSDSLVHLCQRHVVRPATAEFCRATAALKTGLDGGQSRPWLQAKTQISNKHGAS